MQVILTQNVPHLGLLGDEVHVKDGFARNFLLPRGLAIAATTQNARELQHRRRKLEQLRAEDIAAARSEAERFSQVEFTVKAKAGPGGRLFGSVTNRDLQAVLAEKGYQLDRKAIILHEPIKSVGTHAVTVRLHTDVKVDINVRVEAVLVTAPAEGAPAEGAAAAEGGAPAQGAAPAEGGAAPAAGTAEGVAPAPEAVGETTPA
ncbi:MAG: 50S ribosomal protein L9 [Candidatus Lambdaproteobacteria bacterium]|nr:50S ribosomal protein L9 [Candidatus Lambdaproteobacteria bacterium]